MKFEELKQGARYETTEKVFTREEIVEFAELYDHQPLHMDPEFASDGPFGDVIASGFHTISAAWNLWMTHGVMETDGRGGISLDECRWYEPVYPGDRIRSIVTLSQLRITQKGRGFMKMDFQVLNHHDRMVLEFSTCGLIARQEDAPQVEKAGRLSGEP